MKRPIAALASKSLEDGSILTAIEWGDHVILLHQTIEDVLPQTLPDMRLPLIDPNVKLKIELYTLKTKVITRSEFDATRDAYENYMHERKTLEKPRPRLSKS
jgi:hypothetical protein